MDENTSSEIFPADEPASDGLGPGTQEPATSDEPAPTDEFHSDQRYQIPEGGINGTHADAFYGEINFEYEAGVASPRSEQDEFILEHLVGLELITRQEES